MIMNGDRVDAMDSSRDGGMRCLLRLCILCFWFVLPRWRCMVSNFAIRTLVLIYIHKKVTKDSQLLNAPAARQFCLAPSVMFLFLSCSGWRQIYHFPELLLVRLYTFFVTMFGDPSADQTRKHGHIHIVHHPPS